MLSQKGQKEARWSTPLPGSTAAVVTVSRAPSARGCARGLLGGYASFVLSERFSLIPSTFKTRKQEADLADADLSRSYRVWSSGGFSPAFWSGRGKRGGPSCRGRESVSRAPYRLLCSFVCLFEIFTKHLLHARHRSRRWGCGCEQNRKKIRARVELTFWLRRDKHHV